MAEKCGDRIKSGFFVPQQRIHDDRTGKRLTCVICGGGGFGGCAEHIHALAQAPGADQRFRPRKGGARFGKGRALARRLRSDIVKKTFISGVGALLVIFCENGQGARLQRAGGLRQLHQFLACGCNLGGLVVVFVLRFSGEDIFHDDKRRTVFVAARILGDVIKLLRDQQVVMFKGVQPQRFGKRRAQGAGYRLYRLDMLCLHDGNGFIIKLRCGGVSGFIKRAAFTMRGEQPRSARFRSCCDISERACNRHICIALARQRRCNGARFFKKADMQICKRQGRGKVVAFFIIEGDLVFAAQAGDGCNINLAFALLRFVEQGRVDAIDKLRRTFCGQCLRQVVRIGRGERFR